MKSWLLNSVAWGIPSIAALGLGLALASQTGSKLALALRDSQIREIKSQEHSLSDTLSEELISLQTKTLSIAVLNAIPVAPILHWAEYESSPAGLVYKKSISNTAWKHSAEFENHYLKALATQLNLSLLRENGVSFLRIQEDPIQKSELISLAFSEPGSQRIAVILIHPWDAFPVFGRWSKRSEGGVLRAYLLGSDGLVLAHSVDSYIFSNFSSLSIFTSALKPLFAQSRVSGWGDFIAQDQQRVLASYSRLGSLPLAIVVERVNPSLPVLGVEFYIELFAGLAGLALLISICQRAAQTVLDGDAEPEIEQIPTPELPAFHAPRFVADAMESLQVSQEWRSKSISGVDQEFLDRFENDTAQWKTDPKKVALKIVEASAERWGVPVLFFAYHPRVQAAILQAAAGIHGISLGGMSFSLDDSDIDFANYVPMKQLIESKFSGNTYEALPLRAQSGSLLGVLVALSSSPLNLHDELKLRVVASSSALYEKSLEATPS